MLLVNAYASSVCPHENRWANVLIGQFQVELTSTAKTTGCEELYAWMDVQPALQ